MLNEYVVPTQRPLPTCHLTLDFENTAIVLLLYLLILIKFLNFFISIRLII